MADKSNTKLIVVLGPTATGKTRLAVALARKYNGEIISADSRQVFKGMDIGTGKDLEEYGVVDKSAGKGEMALKSKKLVSKRPSGRALKGSKLPSGVPYHLIDIIRPQTPFSVAEYQPLAKKAILDIAKRGKLPMIVGGTGLYIDSVIKGYEFGQVESRKSKVESARKKLDKLTLSQLLSRLKKIDLVTYNKIDQKNRRRVQRALEIYYETGKKKSEADVMKKPDYDLLVIGVIYPLEKIYEKIDSRLEARINSGMIEEIKNLHKTGVSWKRLEEFGLEYRYVSRYVRGLITYEELVEQLRNAIHHFAKRQITWFKRNQEIHWVSDVKQADKLIKEFINK